MANPLVPLGQGWLEQRFEALQRQVVSQLSPDRLGSQLSVPGALQSTIGRRVGNYAGRVGRAIVDRGQYQLTPVQPTEGTVTTTRATPAGSERAKKRLRTATRNRTHEDYPSGLYSFVRERYRRGARKRRFGSRTWRQNANIRFR